MQGFLPRKACDRCHVQKLRCDTTEGNCLRCVKAQVNCVRSPSLRRQRAPRSKRQSRQSGSVKHEDSQGTNSQLYSPYDDSAESLVSSSEADFANIDPLDSLPPLVYENDDLEAPRGKHIKSRVTPGADQARFDSHRTDSNFQVPTPEQDQSEALLPDRSLRASPDPSVSEIRLSLVGPTGLMENSTGFEVGGRGDGYMPASLIRAASDVQSLTEISQLLHENGARMISCTLTRSMSTASLDHNISPRSNPSRPASASDASFLNTVRETFALTRSMCSMLAGKSTVSTSTLNTPSEAQFSALLPSPVDGQQDGYYAMSWEDSRRNSTVSQSLGERQAFQTQASQLFLLSCYLCLLDTYERAVEYIESAMEGVTSSPQPADQHTASYRLAPHNLKPMAQVLSESYRLLETLRENIRGATNIWESDMDPLRHGRGSANDITKPTVLAMKVRETTLRNRMSQIHRALVAVIGNRQ